MEKKRYQVFISSTYEDLKEERMEAAFAVMENNCFPAGMELFAASSESQWEVIRKTIDESDIYIVIIAGRYGSTIDSGKGKKISFTEKEFDYAIETGKPVIALIHRNIDELPKSKSETSKLASARLANFCRKAMQGRIIKPWSNKDDLKSAVYAAINTLIHSERDDLIGWIRADNDINIKLREIEDNSFLLDGEYAKYIDLLEKYLLSCYENKELEKNTKIFELIEKEQKRKLWKKIDECEMTYIIENGYYNVNQDEPYPCHSEPEAREYAYDCLTPEEQEKARRYGFL